MEHVALGFLVALSLVALIFRIGARTVFGYGALADLAAMVVLALLFHGTFAGMSVAIIAGLFFSGFIWLVRRQIGYRTFDFATLAWREVPPEPIRLPALTAVGLLARTGLYTLTFFGLLVVLLMTAAALTGAGVLILAPLVIAAAAALTPLIARRLT